MMEDDTDRALAAKDARIAELEKRPEFVTVAQTPLGRKRAKESAEAVRSYVAKAAQDRNAAQAEVERLRAALEAEKAARVKAVEAEREACAALADSSDCSDSAPCCLGHLRLAGQIRARGGGA